MWNRILSLLRRREQLRVRTQEIRIAMEARDFSRVESLIVCTETTTFDGLVELLRVFEELAFEKRDFALARAIGLALQDAASTSRALDLAQELNDRDLPNIARGVLLQALSVAPFDAVLRSEAALACARAGAPQKAVEVLALHPCLATDPAVLFQFAWNSLLIGDLKTAQQSRVSLREYAQESRIANFIAMLDRALLRFEILGRTPSTLEEYFFLAHGTLVAHHERGTHEGAAAEWLHFLQTAFPSLPRRAFFENIDEHGRASWQAAGWEVVPVRPDGALARGFFFGDMAEVHRVAERAGPDTILCADAFDAAAPQPWVMPHVVGRVQAMKRSPWLPDWTKFHSLVPDRRRWLYHDAALDWPARPIAWRTH